MQAHLSLKVTKYTVDVDVRNVRGDQHRVQVFLAESLDVEGRGERFQDAFLERRFIPVRRDGVLEMLSVEHAVWFRMDLFGGFDELDPQAEQAGAEANANLELEDGSSIIGLLRWYMPAGRRRLVDYLSALPRWVPVRTPEWLYLVSRDRIMRVVPIAES